MAWNAMHLTSVNGNRSHLRHNNPSQGRKTWEFVDRSRKIHMTRKISFPLTKTVVVARLLCMFKTKGCCSLCNPKAAWGTGHSEPQLERLVSPRAEGPSSVQTTSIEGPGTQEAKWQPENHSYRISPCALGMQPPALREGYSKGLVQRTQCGGISSQGWTQHSQTPLEALLSPGDALRQRTCRRGTRS